MTVSPHHLPSNPRSPDRSLAHHHPTMSFPTPIPPSWSILWTPWPPHLTIGQTSRYHLKHVGYRCSTNSPSTDCSQGLCKMQPCCRKIVRLLLEFWIKNHSSWAFRSHGNQVGSQAAWLLVQITCQRTLWCLSAEERKLCLNWLGSTLSLKTCRR